MSRNLGAWLLAVPLLSMALPASAFDGARSGFVLGLGGGIGKAEQSVDVEGGGVSGSVSVDNTGFATEFKLGGGVSEQVLVYYHARSVIYTYDLDLTVTDPFTGMTLASDEISITAFQGISGVGVSYFLMPEAPSAYANVTLGLGSLFETYEGDSNSEFGFGWEAGIGFEFVKGFSAEVAYMASTVASEEFGDASADLEVSNIVFVATWIGY
jgi:hypothetical protein